MAAGFTHLELRTAVHRSVQILIGLLLLGILVVIVLLLTVGRIGVVAR